MASSAKPTDKPKKGHVCPPSNATHPKDRWETAFVYSYILKFTSLKSKTEGFECANDMEEALMSPTQHPILISILSRFLLNLRPLTRNLSAEQISSTLSSILQEYMKGSERTCFWDNDRNANVDPLQGIQGGFWGADWDLKLRILRLLVDLQLTHHTEAREVIDRAWGVVHNKHRKREGPTAPPEPDDPRSQERLSTVPIGQDKDRVRYWALDDTPRLYISTNPWKVTAEFRCISDSREEYHQLCDTLRKANPNALEFRKKMPKVDFQHLKLINTLEGRFESIDAELARIQKARKKLAQKELYKVQAELRSTRTRRQTRRPDYVYHHDESDEDGDEYKLQEDEEFDEHYEADDDDFGESSGRLNGTRRRSLRSSAMNGRHTNGADDWRGERRSTRSGPSLDAAGEGRPSKRARTDERSVSSAPSDAMSQDFAVANGKKLKISGAAAVKPNEIVVEQVAGKKKSKFWFYAVEPVSTRTAPPEGSSTAYVDGEAPSVNGYKGGVDMNDGSDYVATNGNGAAIVRGQSPARSQDTAA